MPSRNKTFPCVECGYPMTKEEIENRITTHNCDIVLDERDSMIIDEDRD